VFFRTNHVICLLSVLIDGSIKLFSAKRMKVSKRALSSEEKAHLETFLLLAKNGSIEPSIINAGNGQIKWLVLKNTN